MKPTTRKAHRLLSIVVLIALISNMIFRPQVVRAQQAAVPPGVAAVIGNGERLMTAGPKAMEHAIQLGQLLADIEQTDTVSLSEATLVSARAHALETAQQAALVQGSLGGMASGLESLEYGTQTPANVVLSVENLSSSGFDETTETAFLQAGFTITQVQALQDGTYDKLQVRQDISQNGLMTQTVAFLESAGLTTNEIADIEDQVASYGLADNSLSDRLAQLRASEVEMSLVRSEALTAYVQLLTRQVIWAQLNGQEGREVTTGELNILAQDQLRLLIHLSYLNQLWGGEPDANIGEGQWLFIERYSAEVLERLSGLILETQNVGLAVDLYLALQIHTTALAAQAGGAEQAYQDVQAYSEALAFMVGDNLPGGQQAYHSEIPFLWQLSVTFSNLLGQDLTAWWATEDLEVESDAIVVANTQAKDRMARLGTPTLLVLEVGDIVESNEDNNSDQAHFYSLTDTVLPPEIQNLIIPYLPNISNILNVVWGVVTGQSSDPWVIGANIVLSFSPVLGIIFDFISLIVEDTFWGKAMALVGFLASILSDGVELLAAIGALIPPTLAVTVPGAILVESLDAGAAVLKGIKGFISTSVWNTIKKFSFTDALKLGGNALTHLSKRAVDFIGGVSHWPSSWNEVLTLMQNIKGYAVDPFSALLSRFGNQLHRVYAWGFGDGGFLLGRVLHLSDDAAAINDEVANFIVQYGDEAGEVLEELSDDAIRGFNEVVQDAGADGVRALDDGLGCVIGAISATKSSRLARPHLQGNDAERCKQLRGLAYTFVGNAAQNWSDEALEGLGRVIDKAGEASVQRLIDLGGITTQSAFSVIARQSASIWNADTVEGLARVFERSVNQSSRVFDYLVYYPDNVVADTLTFLKNVNVSNSNNIFDRVDDLRDLFQLRYKGNSLSDFNVSDLDLWRSTMDNNTYQNFKQDIFDRWNNGNTIPEGNRLAEAFAVESAIRDLTSKGYQEVMVLTKEGINGPDAILKTPDGTWVILEGKGTYTGTDLDGSLFGQTAFGRQLSRNWIINSPERYLNAIDDAFIRTQVEMMIDDITRGGNYQVVVARGGYGRTSSGSSSIPNPLDYGTGIGDFINVVRPNNGSNWSIDFLFVQLLPP